MSRVLLTVFLALTVASVRAETPITESVREFHADFTGDNAPERLNADIPVSLDFSHARAVSFEFGCEDLQTFSHFSLYFKSGSGWYATTFTPHVEGKTERLVVSLKDFGLEGSPAGWNKVSALRFSAWNGAPNKCTVTFGKVRVVDKDEPDVRAERKDSPEYRRRIAERLSRMPPRANERRLVWCHSPNGLGKGRTWDDSLRFLKENGFTDLIANMVWGGSASYDSKVLVRAADFVGKPDPLRECIAACRKYGIKLHVWKVCWHTWWGKLPKGTEAAYRAEERLQSRKDGSSKESWLCPSDPRNRDLEIAAMCELADLGVDGVHYDYIRYPGYDCCFCEGCHRRFEKAIGRKIDRWPEALRGDKALTAKWVDFRAENISAVVGAVAAQLRARHPKTEISAAVMRNATQDRVSVAQDWGRWCREGWLDFVCPMDYTESALMFRGHLRRQQAQVANVKFYPGIGMSCWQEDGGDAERFADQLDELRAAGVEGFTVFDFDRRAEALFPLLRKGPLADARQQDFCLDLDVDLTDVRTNEVVYAVPGSYSVILRQAGADRDLWHYDEWFGNYLNYRLPDGSAPVIEAVLPTAPHSPRPCMKDDLPPGFRVGVPLGILRSVSGRHRVRVIYAKTRWRIEVDGEQVDEDYLVEPIPRPDASVAERVSARVKTHRFTVPTPKGILDEPDARPVPGPIQYWTADGFNTWVGDVVVAERKGRFHVFYLKDRRHHRGKGCTGGHYFAHISSADLVHWAEHPIVTPIEDWWFTCGTGTTFEYGGKLCLSYGIHSTRYVPPERTTEAVMLADCKKNGKMGLYRIGEIPGVPLGATYAVSDDDIHFKPSGVLFHTTQNPALYNRSDGRLGLVAGFCTDSGRWVSDSLSGWTLYDDKMPVKGDCPCLFNWNGHYYILQGFGGYSYSPTDEPGSYKAWSGRDIYDGLNVPMVAPWKGNRRLLVGWVRHFYGWGGWLAFRELVQRDDGTLGTKWVPEIKPPTPPSVYRVKGGQPFKRRFRPVGGGQPMEFGVRTDGALYFADVQPDGSLAKFDVSHKNHDMIVTGTRGLDKPYEVRMVRHYDRKANATIFDAEVAGNRTIICRRPGKWSEERPLP